MAAVKIHKPLHQQLIALYRANRLFDFEKVVEDNKAIQVRG